MTNAPAPVEVRPAATILLLRDVPAIEVLMVKRHHEVDFASGALGASSRSRSTGDVVVEGVG